MERAELIRFTESEYYLNAEAATFDEEELRQVDESVEEAMLRGIKGSLKILQCKSQDEQRTGRTDPGA